MQKQLEETRSILMSSTDDCPYRWATHASIVSNTRASAGINAKSNKTEQSIY